MLFFGLSLVALLFWLAIFLVFFHADGTSVLDYLLGEQEPLPPDLDKWRSSGPESPSGQLREERWLSLPGLFGARLIRQVRYREAEDASIIRVLPDEVVKRPRRKFR